MNSNKLSKAIVIATIAANAFLPFAAMAQGSGIPTGQRQNKARDAQFCAALSVHDGMVRGGLDERKTGLSDARTKRDMRMVARRADQEKKIADIRERQEEKRDTQYDKLEAHADTDAQKAAVEAFKKTVDAAIAKRRAAVDAANVAFKAGIDKAIGERKVKIDAAVAAFETSMKAAVVKAKADCEAGVEPTSIRASLKAATDAARAKLQSDRKEIDRIGETVKALVATRRTAFEKAHAEFKVAMEKARTDLKAALKPVEPPATDTDSNTNSAQ